MTLIDTQVYLSRWPFRRLYGDEPQELMAKLRQSGVEQAWAGSFDALLHHDLGGVNARLAADCRRYGNGLLLPFGSVNPKLPDWREELRRCAEDHRMLGIRVHPNYHGYGLDDPDFRKLIEAAGSRRMTVQIAAMMEDDRTVHPLVKVGMASLEPLPEVVRGVPNLRVQVMNHRGVTPELAKALVDSGDVYLDFAMVEGVHGLKRLLETVPQRVVFSSYFPFYYFEAAALKVKEAEANPATLAANAKRLLGPIK